jgi:hypothetical protein
MLTRAIAFTEIVENLALAHRDLTPKWIIRLPVKTFVRDSRLVQKIVAHSVPGAKGYGVHATMLPWFASSRFIRPLSGAPLLADRRFAGR